MLPDKTKTHNKTVKKLTSTDKVFNTKNGAKRKWLVTFMDGYQAEVCPPEGEIPAEFLEGSDVTFRIGYRKDNYPDEIEAVKENNSEKAAHYGPLASVALATARDLHVVAAKGRYEVQLAASEGVKKRITIKVDIEKLLKDADTIYKWLKQRQE